VSTRSTRLLGDPLIVGEYSSRALYVEDAFDSLGTTASLQSVALEAGTTTATLDTTTHPPELSVLDADGARWLIMWFTANLRGFANGTAWFLDPVNSERLAVDFLVAIDS
jgi:hypothetical protein